MRKTPTTPDQEHIVVPPPERVMPTTMPVPERVMPTTATVHDEEPEAPQPKKPTPKDDTN